MGYFPLLYSQFADREAWRPVETIYPYVESEIPVLVAFENHVVTVVGHKMFDKAQNVDIGGAISEATRRQDEVKRRIKKYRHPFIVDSSIFVDAYIIQDDQQGIYRLLPTKEETYHLLERDGYKGLLPMDGEDRDGAPYFLIRPLRVEEILFLCQID